MGAHGAGKQINHNGDPTTLVPAKRNQGTASVIVIRRIRWVTLRINDTFSFGLLPLIPQNPNLPFCRLCGGSIEYNWLGIRRNHHAQGVSPY